MATRAFTIERVQSFRDDAVVVVWTGLLNGDDGQRYENPGRADRSIQFTGTPSVGGTIILEGSNLPNPATNADYFVLSDPSSTAISKTAASIEAVLELPRWIRPRVTGGDGSTNFQARLFCCR